MTIVLNGFWQLACIFLIVSCSGLKGVFVLLWWSFLIIIWTSAVDISLKRLYYLEPGFCGGVRSVTLQGQVGGGGLPFFLALNSQPHHCCLWCKMQMPNLALSCSVHIFSYGRYLTFCKTCATHFSHLKCSVHFDLPYILNVFSHFSFTFAVL